MPFRVTFDSNVIEYVLGIKDYLSAIPDKCRDKRAFAMDKALKQIRNVISTRSIVPCLSVEYFALESFCKKVRSVELATPPSVSGALDLNNRVGISYCTSREVQVPEIVGQTLVALRSRGGKIITCIRNGLPLYRDIRVDEDLLSPQKCGISVAERDDLFYDVISFIENELNLGSASVCSRLGVKLGDNVFDQIERSKVTSKEKAKLLGEIADCDMVASHIAHHNDFLCTNDFGAGFGCDAILRHENIMRVAQRYSLNVVTPIELLARLDNK